MATPEFQIADAASPDKKRSSWLLPTVTGLAGVLVGVAGTLVSGTLTGPNAVESVESDPTASRTPDVFLTALQLCSQSQTKDIAISDDKTTLTWNNKGKDDLSGISSETMWCLIDVLSAPASVVGKIEQTTAMDGRQTESWDNFEISWSYHPDRGMDAVVEMFP